MSRLGPNVASGTSLQIVTLILQSVSLKHLVVDSILFWCCAGMSLLEIIVGLGLLLRRTQNVAAVLATVMHVLLLATLGPFGLKHAPPVLLWNFYFACSVPLLFIYRKRNPDALSSTQQDRSAGRMIAISVILLFPASGLFGFADNWPAWQLYSPRTDVAMVFVHQESIVDLPEPLQPFVLPPRPLDDWCPVRIDRWSLEATLAPIYPEDRFQLAVARLVMESTDVGQTRIVLQSSRTFPWWKRVETKITSLNDLDVLQERLRLNSRPRR